MSAVSCLKSLLLRNTVEQTLSSDDQSTSATTLPPPLPPPPRRIHQPHRALEILEILEAIFVFLEHDTLLNSTRLVCRFWHTVSKRFLRRELFFRWPEVLPSIEVPITSLEPRDMLTRLWKSNPKPQKPLWPRRRGNGPTYEGKVDMDPDWLAKIPRTTALHLVCDRTQLERGEYWGIWRAILSAVKKQTLKGQSASGHRYQRGLIEFKVEIKTDLSRTIKPDSLLSCLPSSTLTSLHIEVKRPNRPITLDMLMTHLPYLQVFYASSGGYYGHNFFGRSNGRRLDQHEPSTSSRSFVSSSSMSLFSNTKATAAETRLRSISFVRLAIAKDVFLDFIERSPRLQELELKEVQDVAWKYVSTETQRNVTDKHIHRWTQLLVNHPNLMGLRSLQFSMRSINSVPTIDAVTLGRHYNNCTLNIGCAIDSLAALAFELGVLPDGENPASTTGLQHEPQKQLQHPATEPASPPSPLVPLVNRVTALDLTRTLFRQGPCSTVLHRFLCAAPGLLHLRANNVRFAVEHLDVYGQHYVETKSRRARMEYLVSLSLSDEIAANSSTPTASTTLSMPPLKVDEIWACRGLKTLHLDFFTRSGTSSKTSISFEDPVHARVVFGYLSRVTPFLSEMRVSVGALNVGPESGLCLLSRLRHLELLTVKLLFTKFSESLNEHDLAWMTVGGLSKRPMSSPSLLYLPGTHEHNMTQGAIGINATSNPSHPLDRYSKDETSPWHGWDDHSMLMIGTLADVCLAMDEITVQDRAVLRDTWSFWAIAPFSGANPRRRWPVLKDVAICTSDHSNSSALLEMTARLAGASPMYQSALEERIWRRS